MDRMERIRAKIADVREQIAYLQGERETQEQGVGVPLGLAEQIGFQERRLAWLTAAAEMTEAQLRAEAVIALRRFAHGLDVWHRTELDLCRFALGCESLEELLITLEVERAG